MPNDVSISALVAEHGKWLMAFLRGLVGDAADAEDAFQETWVRLMRLRTDIRGSGIRSYLAKTARSVVIDQLRRRHPAESLEVADGSAVEGFGELVVPDESPTPDVRYESKATAEDVRWAIAALPANWRQVVLLRIEGEMEFKEIAAELGIPLGTALTWMRNATQELKAKLGGSR